MSQQTLENLFGSYLKNEPLFVNKEALTAKYTPDNVPHRDEEIKQLGTILAPALRDNHVPSNAFIYGTTGTGKTLVCKHVLSGLKTMAEKVGAHVDYIYVNCKMKRAADTEYRLIATLAQNLGEEVPATGLPTDEVYKIFFKALEEKKGTLIIVLDEVDYLVKKAGDDILYTISRMNADVDSANLSIIGISNDLSFTNNLDARVKSSLGEEELIFKPYNAPQLTEILKKRAKLSFREEAFDDTVLRKCAALAAQEHGDARRALNLLRIAGEIAERKAEKVITEDHVDHAEQKLDMDHILEAVKCQPKQSKAVVMAIINKFDSLDTINISAPMFTGDIFDEYMKVCGNVGMKPLTHRRVSDLISELDMLSIINAQVISRGRHGRTRVIKMAISSKILTKVRNYLKGEFC